LSSGERTFLVCLLEVILGTFFVVLVPKGYDLLSKDTDGRLDALSAGIATSLILVAWLLFVPVVASGLNWSIKGDVRLVVVVSLLVLTFGGIVLVWLLSFVNACNTEARFPVSASC
jgi:hypothetical protein